MLSERYTSPATPHPRPKNKIIVSFKLLRQGLLYLEIPVLVGVDKRVCSPWRTPDMWRVTTRTGGLLRLQLVRLQR